MKRIKQKFSDTTINQIKKMQKLLMEQMKNGKKLKTNRVYTPYIGGKTQMADWLYSLMPKNRDLTIFVEPFGGATAFFKSVDFSNFKEYIYNDLNKLMCNLMACYKSPNEFYQAFVKLTDPGGELYTSSTLTDDQQSLHFQKLWYIIKDKLQNYGGGVSKVESFINNYEVAVLYLFVRINTHNGSDPYGSGSGYSYTKTSISNLSDKINNEMLQFKATCITEITCMDYKDVIDIYDSEDAFIYLDPPYVEKENLYGSKSKGHFNGDEHSVLSSKIEGCKGHIMLSYYYYEMFEKMYQKKNFKWFNKGFRKPSGNNKDAVSQKHNKCVEYLFLNYDPEDYSHYVDYLFESAKTSFCNRKKVNKKTGGNYRAYRPKRSKESYNDFYHNLRDEGVTRWSYDDDFKSSIVRLFEMNVSVSQIHDELGISKSTLYRWKKSAEFIRKFKSQNCSPLITCNDQVYRRPIPFTSKFSKQLDINENLKIAA